MTELAGRYFYPHASRFVNATADIANGMLTVRGEAGRLAQQDLKIVRVSARLGAIPRRFELPDGARFETDDNDGADALLREQHGFHHGFLHRLERSWRWAAVSLVVAVAAGLLFFRYGIPWASQGLAAATPASVTRTMTQGTLATLDRTLLDPSKLSAGEQARAQALFARVAAAAPGGGGAYRLEIREAGLIGPNAFALPDGTIVMTDELWKLVEKDGEIQGVFAHEASHVDRRHGLQRVYQAAFVPAILAMVTGDVTQIATLAAALPAVLIDSAYSQRLEQQADDDAAATLARIGVSPALLADLLERMEKKVCGAAGCPSDWLSSHPGTTQRAETLRAPR